MPSPSLSVEARERVHALLAAQRRVLLGLVGPPGAGKSTVAECLLAEFADVACIVPMDGYHLANVQLQRLGRAARKGAPDTFDAGGYVALLRRLREAGPAETVYAPEFRREIEEPIAGAVAVPPDARLVIAEGNYLLLPESPWREVPDLLDETWYISVDERLRHERLVARHERFGRSRAEALAWVEATDEPNARRIEAARGAADWILDWA